MGFALTFAADLRLANPAEVGASFRMPVPTGEPVSAVYFPVAEQLLLTVGRAGVLSSRAIAAVELETLLACWVHHPNVSGAASYVPPISSWSRTAN